MLVAILSDSHGRAAVVRRALAVLEPLIPQAYFHCGDVGGEEVFDEFVGKRLWFVWGNTDSPDARLRAYLKTVGFHCPDGPVRVELAGKTIALFHGHERQFERELRSPGCDYIFHGHTHLRSDYRVGGTRVVNPGALHRAPVRTVATLDLAGDRLRFYKV